MSYQLEITLSSPLTSSAGNDWANLVDCDVVYNDWGLPEIPGKRLKGLLRDGVRDLLDALELSGVIETGHGKNILEKLFGRPGALFGEFSAVNVGNAYLRSFTPDEDTYKDLTILVKQGVLLAQEVLQGFTSIRAQTSIDPKTGSALENTLRYTRCLKEGLTFLANIEINDSSYINLIAAGTAAVKHMGLSRTRGFGEVKWRLLDEQGNDLTNNVLKNSLNDLLPKDIQEDSDTEKSDKSDSNALQSNTDLSNQEDSFQECLLRFRLELKAEALVPQIGADPNTVTTANYVPGSVILGTFANIFLRSNGQQVTSKFKELFLKDGIKFLNAYPAAADNESWRLLPAPHSLRVTKDTNTLHDLVNAQPDSAGLRRIEGKFVRFGTGLESQEPEKRLHYHHVRASDRCYGRALGDLVTQGGTLFTYEVLKEGQSFIGALIGTKNNLEQLKQLAPNGTVFRIGRSKTSQYGGQARISWLDNEPKALNDCGPEWNNWEKLNSDSNYKGYLIITCLSPMITTNEHGHPAPVFPVSDLENSLGITSGALTLEASWIRTKVIGSFLSHLGLPSQQWPAIAEGSVFKFKLPDDVKLNNQKIKATESSGLGLKRGAGFGRIAINLHGESGYYNVSGSLKAIESIQRQPSKISLDENSPLFDLLSHILCERTKNALESKARSLAQASKNRPSNSTLNRIFLIIRDITTPEKAKGIISDFKKPAKKAMEECLISESRGKSRTLKEIIYDFLDNPYQKIEKQLEKEISKANGLGGFINEPGQKKLIKTNKENWQLARSYLLALLDSLIIQNRT